MMNKKQLKGFFCKAMAGLLVAGMLSVCAVGCGLQDKTEYKYYINYLNQAKTSIAPLGYVPVSDESDTVAMIEEFLGQIDQGTESVEYKKVYPENVELERFEYKDSQVYLFFNSHYNDMPADEEAFCRGCIVKTLMQIEGVQGISFFVDNMPMTDANGEVVGVMNSDSFVDADDPNEKINNIQVADLILYFASLDGKSLVSETQHVHYYSSNLSTEKLVMEQLLEGPVSANAQSAIPANTGLISVSVMDGACIVNLDENFMSQNYNIQEDVVIYSIVDSLAELPNITTVQISINGETNMIYRQDLSLSDYYYMNLDLIEEEGEDVDINLEKTEKEVLKEGLIDTGE